MAVHKFQKFIKVGNLLYFFFGLLFFTWVYFLDDFRIHIKKEVDKIQEIVPYGQHTL